MEPKYLWVVWHYGGARPEVKRYTLLTVHDSGCYTVQRPGRTEIIRPASGRRFFTDEAEMLTHYRKSLESKLESAKRSVESLTADLAAPDLGLIVDVQVDEYIRLNKKPKTE